MSNIVITGANQGIGYYFVEQAIKDGHKVAVLDINTDNLERLAQLFPNKLFYYKADVCDEMQIRIVIAAIIEKFQRIDIAIHNACSCTFVKEAITDFNTYERVLMSITMAHSVCQKVYCHICKRKKRGKLFLQALV